MDTNTIEHITFGLNQLPWLQEELWGNRLWQYVVFFIYCLAAVFLSKLADVLMANHFKKAALRTRTTLDDKLVELLRGPLKLTVFLILLHLGLKLMNKPDWLQTYLSHAFGIIVAVIITYGLMKFVDVGFELAKERMKDHDPRTQDQILVLLRKTVKVFVILSAVLVTADNNGFDVKAVLASLGVTGLAVALAAQETLSNLLGSIVVLADRPFFLGDRVQIGADTGVVEYIGIRSTRLLTPEGDVITIPNRTVAASVVKNFSKTTKQLTEQPGKG
jgi:MscS family membrane protein